LPSQSSSPEVCGTSSANTDPFQRSSSAKGVPRSLPKSMTGSILPVASSLCLTKLRIVGAGAFCCNQSRQRVDRVLLRRLTFHAGSTPRSPGFGLRTLLQYQAYPRTYSTRNTFAKVSRAMPPKKKSRLSSRGPSTPSTENLPPTPLPASQQDYALKPTNSKDLLADPWTDEQETALLKSLMKWKPIGQTCFFPCNAIQPRLNIA